MPRQEPGTRPSCALPYELAADGNLSQDRQRFALALEARNERFGNAAAGAPFTAYATFKPNDIRIRNYAVAAGDRLEDAWSLSDFAAHRYLVSVHGPNGFYRDFRGNDQDPTLTISCEDNATTATAHLKREIAIEIVNRDKVRRTKWKSRTMLINVIPSTRPSRPVNPRNCCSIARTHLAGTISPFESPEATCFQSATRAASKPESRASAIQ